MVERKTAGEVCLDGKRIACQPPKNVIRRQPLGPTSVLHARIGIGMAIVARNRYSDARNWRSSGVSRFILSIVGFLSTGCRPVVAPYDTLIVSDESVMLPGGTKEELERLLEFKYTTG